jgi:flagella basal body P-ring formation protein FlgA
MRAMIESIQQRMLRLLFIGSIVVCNVLPISAAEVVMLPVTKPSGTVVVLGDVAKVRAEKREEAARLSAIPLVPAPREGRKRFLRMREVQDLLAAHGEDLGGLDFRGELVVEISAPAPAKSGKPQVDRQAIWAGTSVVSAAGVSETEVPQPAPLRQAEPEFTAAQTIELHMEIERTILAHLEHYSGRQADWQVSFDAKPSDLAKVLAATSTMQCSGGVAPWTGKQNFVIAFATARGPVRVRLETEVTGMQPVVVAVRQIERGQVISAADVRIENRENMPVATGRRSVIESLEAIVGMEATRAIPAGEAIFNDEFRAQLLVKRGEEIAVVARGNGIKVRTIARATQDGGRGDLICVETLETKEKFHAVVTASREALVYTGSVTPTTEQVAKQPFRKLQQN